MNEALKNDIILKLKEQAHKENCSMDDWDIVDVDLLLVADWFVDYCENIGLRCQFTRIIDKPIPGVSVSDSHNKRAFDASLIGWTDADARECAHRANHEIGTLGAVSKRDGRRRVAVFEPREYDDNGKMKKERHLHFQVSK
jgi:hypothetical protein